MYLHLNVVSILLSLCSAYIVPSQGTQGHQIVTGAAEDRVTSLGFDLSASYGAVAISFHNGTQVAIARIDADDEYKNFMAEASRGDGRAGPFPGTPNEWPVFAKMLQALRNKAEDYLGYKVEAALVATPTLPGERTGTLHQIMREIGLKNLDNFIQNQPNSFRQTPAAEAAAGLGICHNYHDTEACKKEHLAMPVEYVVTILFTSNALCVEFSRMYSAYVYHPYGTLPTSMDFTLGYDLHDKGSDNGASYWAAVQERVMRGTLAAFPYHVPSLVFMYGDADAVGDPHLRAIVDNAMTKIVGKTLPVYDADPVFAVARGAAELAKRGSWPWLRDLAKQDLLSNGGARTGTDTQKMLLDTSA